MLLVRAGQEHATLMVQFVLAPDAGRTAAESRRLGEGCSCEDRNRDKLDDQQGPTSAMLQHMRELGWSLRGLGVRNLSAPGAAGFRPRKAVSSAV